MSEVAKMYKNAGVEPICDGIDCGTCTAKCNNGRYPEFAAEKQIEIVCFLINRGVKLSFNCEQGKINMQFIQRGLAGLINSLWQDLTESEREQIKEVLNG